MKVKTKKRLPYLLILIALVFIFVGILREENLIVMQKAVKICLECIGVG